MNPVHLLLSLIAAISLCGLTFWVLDLVKLWRHSREMRRALREEQDVPLETWKCKVDDADEWAVEELLDEERKNGTEV
jgi:hypothetical protein